jgi:hypothetical protein
MKRVSGLDAGVSRGVRRAASIALAMAALLAAGCGGGGVTAAGGTETAAQTSSTSGSEAPFTEPPVEPTSATVAPTTGSRKEDPAISVARLPIGGSSEADVGDPGLQCAHVSWSVSRANIPTGVGIEVAGFRLTGGTYLVVPSGCGTDVPDCRGYVLRAGQEQCDLALRAVPGSGTDEAASVGLKGRVYCPDKTSATCTRFIALMGQEKQFSIGLEPPPPLAPEPPEPPPPTASTGEPSTTSEPEPSSTDTGTGG